MDIFGKKRIKYLENALREERERNAPTPLTAEMVCKLMSIFIPGVDLDKAKWIRCDTYANAFKFPVPIDGYYPIANREQFKTETIDLHNVRINIKFGYNKEHNIFAWGE